MNVSRHSLRECRRASVDEMDPDPLSSLLWESAYFYAPKLARKAKSCKGPSEPLSHHANYLGAKMTPSDRCVKLLVHLLGRSTAQLGTRS